jgi:hypothetical protein
MHHRYIVVAAAIDRNGQVLKVRTNRMQPPFGVWGQYGFHAERRLLDTKSTDARVVVARFNVADLTADHFNPLCAKPCPGCQSCIRETKPHRLWYVDWAGQVVRFQ